ncbi:hypothetical protein KYY02_19225 [Streptomyces pimonensis]|uniref:DUF222 domain-containing protein n=1 Tax=Streptomyces pimonensis TaxID=2860288 RepID=A0ABV4J1J2_9ACTN
MTHDLAAALEGMERLITTSSRDWGTYRVDAWLYAVLVGWDCEDTTHDDTCVHGALEEMASRHGWDADAVAKARRYRAAVRAAVSAAVAPLTGRAALREAVAEAIHADRFPDHSWERQPEAIRDDYRGTADAVLAVLPEPADRTVVLREAAEALGRMDYDTDSRDYGYDTYCDAWNGGVMDGADLLRRMADETATETPARTPCSVPECDADGTGEPCTRHEREDAHAEGDHELCGAECEPAAGARQDGAQSSPPPA